MEERIVMRLLRKITKKIVHLTILTNYSLLILRLFDALLNVGNQLFQKSIFADLSGKLSGFASNSRSIKSLIVNSHSKSSISGAT